MSDATPYVLPSLPPQGSVFQHIYDGLRAHAYHAGFTEDADGYNRGLIKAATRTSGRRMAGMAGMAEAEGCLEAIQELRREVAARVPGTLSAVYVGPAAGTEENWAGFARALDDLEANVRRWAMPGPAPSAEPEAARPRPRP